MLLDRITNDATYTDEAGELHHLVRIPRGVVDGLRCTCGQLAESVGAWRAHFRDAIFTDDASVADAVHAILHGRTEPTDDEYGIAMQWLFTPAALESGRDIVLGASPALLGAEVTS